METKRLILSDQEVSGVAHQETRSYCIIRSNKLRRKSRCFANNLAQQNRSAFVMKPNEQESANCESCGYVVATKSDKSQGDGVRWPLKSDETRMFNGFSDHYDNDQMLQKPELNAPKNSPTSIAAIEIDSFYLEQSQVKTRRSTTTEFRHDHHHHLKRQHNNNWITRSSYKSKRNSFARFIVVILFACSLSLFDLQSSNKRARQQAISNNNTSGAPNFIQLFEQIYASVLFNANTVLLASAQQYKPEWPHKTLEQEIFLLNLEDGYFGCQVNSSQDFLQLFELSRLCDGQAQCYLGTDELIGPLKCRNRERCATNSNSSSASSIGSSLQQQQEVVQCINGVCLDGLCYCNDGYGGKSCDIPDENECKFRPCDVFAHCTNTMGSYYCSCFPGYDGDGMHCQDINECEIPSLRALCSDNSECVNLPGHFVCKCKPGYQQSGQSQSSLTGAPIGNATVQCTDIDECLDDQACGKGAICENLPGSFKCTCPQGFTGDPAIECFDMDECRNNPCGLGAQCTNIPGGYRCSCEPGHERNPVAPAHMFGTILSSSDQGQQQQLAELTNTTLIACLDINECLPSANNGKSVCGTGAQCINTQGGYFCQCPPGYSGNPKVACLDIDECASHACGPNAQCKNLAGSFKCECKQGYLGNAYLADGCQDEDECLRKDACGLHAQCFNTLGSFQCSCLSGFTGDAYSKCSDIDECSSGNPCGQGAQCVNLDGGYKCTCPDKYLARGTPEMGCERAAVDIGCTGDFDCTQNALCINSTCQCKLGYQINGIDCVDVDECHTASLQQSPVLAAPVKAFTRLSSAASTKQNNASNSGNGATSLCGLEAMCHNTDGSFRCDCKPGYEKFEPQVPTSKCHDVNECEQTPSVCGQNSKCFNTDGAFKCLCNDGFIPIDPEDPAVGCKSPCDGVSCGQHATCKPHGEEAACVCKPGFTFDPNNIKLGCVDINECDTNYGPSGLCGQKAICTNVPGSYRCHCPSGFAGDAYRYCEDINECDRKFGVFGQCGELAICTNKPGSFSCNCAPGYTGDPKVKCADIDECSVGKCGLNAICTNAPGKYSCRCPEGYTGDPNDKCIPEQPPCSSSTDCPANQVCQSGRCQCPFQQNAEGHCKHPCDKTECGAHATCQLDSENQALCVCDAGYMALSDGRSGCVDVNECIQGITLSGMTPISALNSANGGAVPLGPSSVNSAAGNTTNAGHPCGRNAICRNQPGSFDCVCPTGYSGNAYEGCNLDVRNQQAITTTTTVYSSDQQQQQNAFGNYQQEPRTSSCSEPCQRGQICSDGQCVKPDLCRDNLDCRPTHSCERVNQILGLQCVAVCELQKCGPEAKCTPQNHKPICACNSTAGYAGDPYDLVNGCKLQSSYNSLKTTTTITQQSGGTVSLFDQFGSLSTGTKQQDQFDLHRTTVSNQQQVSTGGDISAVSFDYGSSPPANKQQQQHHTLSPATVSFTTNASSSAAMDQLQRQQVLEQQAKGPNQPLIAYELPLPTTPLLPQFDSIGQTSKTSAEINQHQQQAADQYGQTRDPSQPNLGPSTTTTSLFSTKKNQQQQQQQQQQIDQQNAKDRQEFGGDTSRQEQQKQLAGQSGGKTTVQFDRTPASQFDSGSFDQFSNKSAVTSTTTTSKNSNYVISYKQVACTSDLHCPGNLFCLGHEPVSGYDSHVTKSSLQKTCGCPAGYKRESDYCFMQRVNCSSATVCKPREECIPGSILRQGFSLSSIQQQATTISQQFTLGVDEQSATLFSNGICICPRGYKLTTSGLACIDRNECDEGTPCAVGAICQNKIGSYECVCPPGTIGDPYTKTCEPLVKDECQTNSDCASDRECDTITRKCVSPCHLCGPRAICTATNHVATCLCPPRYTGNALDRIYGCQEPSAPLTTTTSTTVANTSSQPGTTTRPASGAGGGPSTAVGVPVTTLLSSTTTVAPLDSTTPELVEFRTIPPSELFVMCLADGIQVEVQLGGFDGIIYVKGHSQDPKCRKLVTSSNANEFVDFKVQFGNCDLIHRDGEAGFVLVIQKHPKLVTYRARAYHVKCVYNTGERTVTLGFNVSMITTSGTIANTGPPPTCLMSITSLEGREVTSAEIGQDLLLRVDVQPDSIYGGFARSCEAKTMDDEGEYQYEVTDANGCATDPSIFSDWNYDQQKKSLVARFNAFKFPSSNNLRFQCNIRVCFGSCPAVNCNGVDAYGKRRRRREAPSLAGSNNTSSETSLENAEAPTIDELIVTETFKEGALREEIMVQSNAILTFDKKEASLPQQQQKPLVEDIEFVCLPRLGIVMSIALTTLLIFLALTVASSCWCFAKRRRAQQGHDDDQTGRRRSKGGPLPHPVDFPNPLMRSTSTSTLRDSFYGP